MFKLNNEHTDADLAASFLDYINDSDNSSSNSKPSSQSEEEAAAEQASAMLDYLESDDSNDVQPSKELQVVEQKSRKKKKSSKEPKEKKKGCGCGCLIFVMIAFLLILLIIVPTNSSSSSSSTSKRSTHTSVSSSSKVTVEKSNTVDPQLKRVLDDYEEFVDSYISFMKKLDSTDMSDLTWVNEYSAYMEKLEDYGNALDAYKGTNLTGADLEYYSEVTTRVYNKLIKAGL